MKTSIAILCTFLAACTTTTTYHPDGSKTVVEGTDAAALAAITATAIAFAPQARVIEQKSGPVDPRDVEITDEEIEARFQSEPAK